MRNSAVPSLAGRGPSEALPGRFPCGRTISAAAMTPG